MCFLTTSLNWCDTSLLLVYYLVLHHTLVDCLIASNSFFLPLELSIADCENEHSVERDSIVLI